MVLGQLTTQMSAQLEMGDDVYILYSFIEGFQKHVANVRCLQFPHPLSYPTMTLPSSLPTLV